MLNASSAGGGLRILLPDCVEVEQTDRDSAENSLFSEERACLAGSVAQRRAEYATVRRCARIALSRLGYRPVPIPSGPHREPVWPAGVTGSMTHCAGYRAAAVSRTTDLRSIGIDAEPNSPLPPGVLDLITVGREPQLLAQLSNAEPHIAWGRVLFSAKERIYKAWYPLTSSWLDFTQCELSIGAGTFTGRLLVPPRDLDARRLDRITGRWTIHGHHILTAAYVPTRPLPSVARHADG